VQSVLELRLDAVSTVKLSLLQETDGRDVAQCLDDGQFLRRDATRLIEEEVHGSQDGAAQSERDRLHGTESHGERLRCEQWPPVRRKSEIGHADR
jgi:hypothetical protein